MTTLQRRATVGVQPCLCGHTRYMHQMHLAGSAGFPTCWGTTWNSRKLCKCTGFALDEKAWTARLVADQLTQ